MTDPYATAKAQWVADNPRPGRMRQVGNKIIAETDAEYAQASDDGAAIYMERKTAADAEVTAKSLRQKVRDFRATIAADKAAIAAAPVTTSGNIVAQFNALRDMMTHQQNGWLGLLDFLENQVMQRDDAGPLS